MSNRGELESGQLREVALRDVALSVPIYLVHRKDKLFSAIQRDLMEAVGDEFGRSLTAA
jgi:hypothetical protein